MTSADTSSRVADYFWPEGADEAVVVQSELNRSSGYRMMAAVANTAEGEKPILISSEGNLSSSTIRAIRDLGVSEVTVYSTNSSNVEDQLQNIGVDAEVNEGTEEQLIEQIQQNIQVENDETVIATAATQFTHILPLPSHANAETYLFTGNEMNQTIGFIQGADAEDVIATGNQSIVDQLENNINETQNQEEVILSETFVDNPKEISASFFQRSIEDWAESQRNLDEWKADLNENEDFQRSVDSVIEQAEQIVQERDVNASEEAQTLVRQARQQFEQNNFVKARDLAIQSVSIVNLDLIERRNHTEIPEAPESNVTQNETRNQTGERVRIDRSSIKVDVRNGNLSILANYTAPTAGYDTQTLTDLEGNNIEVDFQVSSPDEATAQVLTIYTTKVTTTLDPGRYTVDVDVVVDGEEVNTVEQSVSIGDNIQQNTTQ